MSIRPRSKHRPIPSMTYSDWEAEQSEAQYLSDALPPPPSTRTDTELNLAVLKRHNPSVLNLVHVSPYAVVYEFSPALSTWEKAGIEGSAFIVSLIPTSTHPIRFGVIVLNRRGLDSFEFEFETPEEIEITEEYIILQRAAGTHSSTPAVYGLWIFAEPPPASTATQRDEVARKIVECAEKVEAAQKRVLQDIPRHMLPQLDGAYEHSPDHAVAADMARKSSLTAMLEQQRQTDDAWSMRSHSPSSHTLPQFHQQPPSAGFMPNFAPSAADTDFFLSARPHGTGTRTTPSPAVSAQGSVSGMGLGHKENLLDLFKKAGENYRSTAI